MLSFWSEYHIAKLRHFLSVKIRLSLIGVLIFSITLILKDTLIFAKYFVCRRFSSFRELKALKS